MGKKRIVLDNLKGWLKIFRISNWPTVVSNGLAALAVSSSLNLFFSAWALAILAGLSAYAGGMILNDFYDYYFDKVHQPYRPLVTGEIKRNWAGWVGYILLSLSILFFVIAQWISFEVIRTEALLLSIALNAVIVIYDVHHKENHFAPFLMGLCRGLLILATGYAVSPNTPTILFVISLAMTVYVTSITWAAKHQWMGPRMGFAIAAISLLDSFWLLWLGKVDILLLTAAAFPLTIFLQKWVRGT